MSLLSFPIMGDERGKLIALESFKEIPFDIKRVYYIFDTKQEVARGFHAHKNLSQVLICVKGSCRILLDNGKVKENFLLTSPNQGILIKDLIWREMHDFSEDCVLLVLASNYYDESDYIRDYDKFLKETSITLVEFDKSFLDKSFIWLNDSEIKYLTMTPNLTREQQEKFFDNLPLRKDYWIYGIQFGYAKIGACGLKNISDNRAELWLYIGEKSFWGKGIGGVVMRELEKIAIQNNISTLFLKVLKQNMNALTLYERLGYVITEDQKNYCVMEKVL